MEINHLLEARHFLSDLRLNQEEDVILLTRKGDVLAVFSAVGATLENILLEADKHVKENE